MVKGIAGSGVDSGKVFNKSMGLGYLWQSDLFRYKGQVGFLNWVLALLRIPGYQYSFLLRLCNNLLSNKMSLFQKILYRICFEILRQVGIR